MTPGNAMLLADSACSSWPQIKTRIKVQIKTQRKIPRTLSFLKLALLCVGLLCLNGVSGCSPAPPEAPRDQAVPPAPAPAPTARVPTARVVEDESEETRTVESPADQPPAEPIESEESTAESDEQDTAASKLPIDPRPLQAPAAAEASPTKDPLTKDSATNTAAGDSPAADAPPKDPNSGRNPAEIAAEKAFAEPAEARRLSPDARLWIDPKRGRLIVDGYVTLREGPLEMFACPVGTKEHESVVSVLALSRYVHAGLLAIDAMPGTPVSFSPEYRPATGQRIAIWVMWRNAEGEIKKVPAQQWIKQTGTEESLDIDWVFAGSSFWRDPSTGQEYYQADSGDLVCVSNFSTALLDLPVESSQSNAALQYSAFTEHIPPRGTPVRLVFIPVPLPADEPLPGAEDRVDPRTPPEDELLKPQPADTPRN